MTSVLPLARYTVLDLTIARAGPTAVRLLADWGANVIKIEPPPVQDRAGGSVTGTRHGPDDQNLHRNKRGLCIDLKHEDGIALFRFLVAKSDVVVENFRADVKRRLGIEYEQLLPFESNSLKAIDEETPNAKPFPPTLHLKYDNCRKIFVKWDGG